MEHRNEPALLPLHCTLPGYTHPGPVVASISTKSWITGRVERRWAASGPG